MDPTVTVARGLGPLAHPGPVDAATVAALLAEVRARLFAHAVTPASPPAASFGRYLVRGPLGAGGSGVVLRAHDPQLGRDVAIKLVRHGADAAAPIRLLREARAIARLAHPNVVAVYDVGRLEELEAGGGTGVYVVMELVEGEDLARWLATPRSVDAILDAYAAAGQGLVAAHAHGLLHRDFKPHNVLRGHDGRVRVADFGLTLARGPSTPSVGPVLDASLTADGMIVGTPLYMSPEQQAGGAVDARTDQYAFCFALREALWGRPRLTSLEALRAFKAAPPSLPPRRGVSRTIARAIERGLSPDPEARWPSMEALLDALERGRRRTARRWALGLVLGLGGIGLATHGGSDRVTGPCAPGDPGWSRVWDDDVAAAVAAAFERSAPSFAGSAIAAVDPELRRRGEAWTATRDRLCDASPSPEAVACLEQRRAAAEAIVGLWRAGTAEATAHAVDAAVALDDPRACDPTSGHGGTATDNDAEVIAIESQLAAGRIVDAADAARTLAPRLSARSGRAAARAGLAVGAAFDAAGEFAAAETALARAYDEAQGADDHATAVRIGARLVTVTGVHLGRPEDADLWARHAWTALARADDAPALRAEVVLHLGHLAAARGQWQRALDHYLEHAEALRVEQGADGLGYARALENVANTRIHLGDPDGAIEVLRRTLDLERARLGDAHPDVAVTRHNLSTALLQRGDIDEAEVHCRAALAAWRATYGEHHPDVGLARYSLGSILLGTGRAEEAVTELRAAVELRRALLGEEHSDVLGTMNNLANALDAVDRPAEALEVMAAVIRIYERPGTERPDHGIMRLNYGNLLRRTGDLAGAEREHARAIERLTADVGPDHVATGVARFSLATDLRIAGDLDGAEREIDDSIAVLRRALPESHARWVGPLQERGRIAAARGDHGLARDAFAAALAQHAANPGADESVDELRAELAAAERAARRSAGRDP